VAPASDTLPSLHEVLVAFQKSVSRARQQAQSVSAEDPEIRNGQKALFLVDSLDADLRVGIDVVAREGDPDPDIVRLNFAAPADQRSSIRFRVSVQPVGPTEA
jgi:hypothetical protein